MPDNNNLPIKFFATRDIDNLRVEGGPNDPPKWLLKGEALALKSAMLTNTFKGYKEVMEKKEKANSFIPLILKTHIVEDKTAKSHRVELSNLFRVGSSENVIGLTNSDELLIKVNNVKETDVIVEKLSKAELYDYALSCIESIEEFTPDIKIEDESHKANYKIKLVNYQDFNLNNAANLLFERTVKKHGFSMKKTEYAPGYRVYSLQAVVPDNLEVLKREEAFETIFSIEPMPQYRITLDAINDDMEIKYKLPQEGRHYVTVGILDSGIKEIDYLNPWLGGKWTVYPEESIDRSHGTFVSGVVLYGDELEGKEWIGTEGCRLLDANVFPNTKKEEIDEDELVSNIQRVVKAYANEVKIWNLSISITRSVTDDKFSDFAIALDALQDEFNILICKSAGNCSNFLTGKPRGRIHEGADSVRALVVGALAHKKNDDDIADIDNPSPFSRVGRGPSYIIKPELVHYGGNAGIDSSGKLVQTGVKSFGLDGTISKSVGTSFSTPRITALAAGLHQEIAEEFDPLLIKTLMIHSAMYPELLNVPNDERVNQVGFGKPKKVRDIIYNAPHEATLILRDELPKSEFIDIMDFPMPECLIENGCYTGQIIVTLLYNPILSPSQGPEYCQSNIDIKMGTYDKKVDRDTTRRTILNPVGRSDPKNILLERFYSSRKIKSNQDTFALQERLLIQYADKYYPVKKYAVDLSEVTEATKRYLAQDRKWFLFLRGLFRDHAIISAQRADKDLSQYFCLAVTLRDPSGKKPVYDQVTQKLDEYNFWHHNIMLHEAIELRI